jgi:hypothetical protein
MTRLTPVRKVKNGSKGSYYEANTSCGKLDILIVNGEDEYPIRLTAQPSGGGCHANLEAVQRLTTLLLEMNTRADIIIEQLNKPICQACKSKMVKGDKEIALSCSKAIGKALEQHMGGKE